MHLYCDAQFPPRYVVARSRADARRAIAANTLAWDEDSPPYKRDSLYAVPADDFVEIPFWALYEGNCRGIWGSAPAHVDASLNMTAEDWLKLLRPDTVVRISP